MSKPLKVLIVVCALIMLDYDAYMIVNLDSMCHHIRCIGVEKVEAADSGR